MTVASDRATSSVVVSATVGEILVSATVGEKLRGVPAYSPFGEIRLFLGKCGQALKSRQALGLEVGNSKGEGGVGGTLRTSWKPRDQGVQEKKRATVEQEPERCNPDPIRG